MSFPLCNCRQQHDEKRVMRPKTRTKLKRKPVNGMRPRDGQEFHTYDGVNIVVRAYFRNHIAGAIDNLKQRFCDGRLQQHPYRV